VFTARYALSPYIKQPRFIFKRVSVYYYFSKLLHLINFADDQVLITQDHDDMEFMARKLKEEYENWGLTMNLEKNKYMYV